MKYIIPQNKIDTIVFKYLDMNLKGLEKKKPMHYKGIVFAYPDEEYGVLGWENDNTLYIYYDLIEEISEIFGLDESDSDSIISRWVSDRYKLEVTNTNHRLLQLCYQLAIDTN